MNNSLEEFGTEVEKNSVGFVDLLKIDAQNDPVRISSEQQESKVKANICQYSVDGKTFWPCGVTRNDLPSGVYTVNSSPNGLYFQKENLVIDDLITFEDGLPREILDEIDKFWENGRRFR